jgi:hypothetical protein
VPDDRRHSGPTTQTERRAVVQFQFCPGMADETVEVFIFREHPASTAPGERLFKLAIVVSGDRNNVALGTMYLTGDGCLQRYVLEPVMGALSSGEEAGACRSVSLRVFGHPPITARVVPAA